MRGGLGILARNNFAERANPSRIFASQARGGLARFAIPTKLVFRKQNVLDFLPRISFLWLFYGRASLPGCKKHMEVLVWTFSARYEPRIKIDKSRAKFHMFR